MNSARIIVDDLASRLANRVQISTDDHRAFIHAIKGNGTDGKGIRHGHRADKEPTIGNPDVDRICTSHVERQNLSMRMGMRRFTRSTNAFSKKAANHVAMV